MKRLAIMGALAFLGIILAVGALSDNLPPASLPLRVAAPGPAPWWAAVRLRAAREDLEPGLVLIWVQRQVLRW